MYVLVASTAGCHGEPATPVSVTTSAITSGTIAGVNDRDLGPCPGSWGGSCHYYELYSDGSHPFADPDPANYQYRAIALCNGAAYSAIPGRSDSTAITFQSPGQINVAVRTADPNPSCWLQLEYSARNYDVDPSPNRTDPDPSYTNLFGPVTKIALTDILDLGTSGSPAKQVLQLTGSFPTGGIYTSNVTCNLTQAASQITSVSTSAIELAIDPRTAPSDCVVSVHRVAAGFDFFSNTFHVRLGGEVAAVPASVALYYWGGYQPPAGLPSTLSSAFRQIAGEAGSGQRGAGFQSLRIRLHPGVRLGGSDTLGIDPASALAQCPASVPRFLGCGIAMTEYQQALASLPIATPSDPVNVMMTVYDSSSVGDYFLDWRVTDVTWMSNPTNQASVKKEYEELAYALYKTQVGTGRRFIVTNWESDNQIYCGDMTSYANTQGASCPGADSYFDAFKLWMQLRHQGIAEGFARATADGYTASSTPPAANSAIVADGIEFNSYKILHDHTPSLRSTLYDIIEDVKPAYASYSSWESANRGALDEDLAAIQGLLSSTTGDATQLVIGELGSGYGQPFHFMESLKAAYRARLPVISLWEAFPTGVPGLMQADGSETSTLVTLRNGIVSYASSGVLPPQAIQIAGVVDRGIDGASPPIRWFELYGSFPTQTGTSYSVVASCMLPDGISSITYAGTIGFQSTGQINAGIADPAGQPTWCSFSVNRSGTASPIFGPRRICSVTAPFTNPGPCP